MMNGVDNENNIIKKIFEARKELLVNKNISKAIIDLTALLQISDVENIYIIKSILALAYMENKDYSKAAEIFNQVNGYYQAGFCELLQGNIDKAKEIWEKLPENSIVQWGTSLLGFIILDAKLSPSFLQIRNYLECDIAYLIKADKLNYAENLIAYSEFLASIHPEAYKFIGKALFNTGYPNLAMNYYNKGKDFIPNDAEIYYLIAQYFYGQNSLPEAKQSLKKCLSLNKSYVPAKELLEFIETKARFKK